MKTHFTRWNMIALIGFALLLATGVFSVFIKVDKQIDFHEIYYASSVYRLGVNPYDSTAVSRATGQQANLPFVYPPYTLLFFRPFLQFDFKTAARLYLILKVCAVACLLFLWHRIFNLLADRRALFLPVIPLAFNASLIYDLRVGNVSTWEQLLIWSAFYCYLKGRPAMFAAFIVAAASFKLIPILLLGLLAVKLRKRELLIMVSFGLLFLAILGLNRLVSPQLFASFIENLHHIPWDRGEGSPSTLTLSQDIVGWLSSNAHFSPPAWAPFLLYLPPVSAAAFVSAACFRRLNLIEGSSADLLRICLVCFLYAIAVPRFKDYSYILLIAPALYILVCSRWINYLVPCCALLAVWTWREFEFAGTMFKPFYRVEAEYYCLALAWIFWGLCVANICIYPASALPVDTDE